MRQTYTPQARAVNVPLTRGSTPHMTAWRHPRGIMAWYENVAWRGVAAYR